LTSNEANDADSSARPLSPTQRFWRNRLFARIRHRLGALRRSQAFLTRGHAAVIRWSGGRIRRSYLFTGGMPILVLTTRGRKTGKQRSTPLGYLRLSAGFAVLASNAGSDHVPAWWLNLQARPDADVYVDGKQYPVTARVASPAEDEKLWSRFKQLNPGFDEYRHLTDRRLPVVLLEHRQHQLP
jgi:F420H(2)-dependent quinone reductase